jgi:starch synthase
MKREEWNPETDRLIPFNYRPSDFQNKRLNKERLLQAFELSVDNTVPVFGMVDGPGAEGGMDLLRSVGDRLLSKLTLRLVILGTGDPGSEAFLRELRAKHPDTLGVHAALNDPLAHLVLAGADVLLMPRRDGPPADELARALRYGCVPVVNDTEALRESLREFEPISGRGNAFLMRAYEPEALFAAVARAVSLFEKQRTLKKLVSKIMALR